MNIYRIYLHILAFIGLSAYAEDLANEWYAAPWNSKAKEAAGRDYLGSLPQREFTDEDIEEMQRLSEESHRQELVENYGYDFRLPWHQQPDGSSALLAMPDSVMDRMFR